MARSSQFALISALAALAASALPAAAQDFEFPTRRGGQWEIKMIPEMPGAMPEMTMTACIDEATDKQMMAAGLSLSKEMCPQQEIRQEGNDYVIDSTCQISGMTTTSHAIISGDFQSAYTVKITSEITGAPVAMPGAGNMTQEARWISETCADGMGPGDMTMPGGMKVNINDMMKAMGGG